MINFLKKTELIGVSILFIILIILLFIRPVIGIADNGDFNRIMAPTGISHISDVYEEKYYGFVNIKFNMKPIGLWGDGNYISSQNIPVRIAMLFNKLFYSNTIFDIRFLSFIYSIILLIATYLILKYIKTKNTIVNWIILIFFTLIVTDATNLGYFNSLYGEPVAFLFLLLTMGLVCFLINQSKPNIWILISYFLSVLLFVGSKLQYNILSIVFVLFSIALFTLRKDKLWKVTIAIGMTATILYSAIMYSTISAPLNKMTVYSSVFDGILKDSPSPNKDLIELGLSKDLIILANTQRFTRNLPLDPDGEYMQKEFYDKISNFKVIDFYINHPFRLLSKMEVTANMAMQNDKKKLGYYEKNSGHSYQEIITSPKYWSNIKNLILPKTLWFMIPYYLIFGLFLIKELTREKNENKKIYLYLIGLIYCLSVIQFPMPIIGNGEADMYKQLFMFNFTYDILLIISIVYFLSMLVKKFNHLFLKQW